MLLKVNRLTRKNDFGAVFKKGKGFKEGFLILRFVSNKIKNCRFGIIVSRKISKRATVRNKIKRRIRGIIKPKIPKIKTGADIVFFALPGLETKDFWEIEETINKLLKKAKLIKAKRTSSSSSPSLPSEAR